MSSTLVCVYVHLECVVVVWCACGASIQLVVFCDMASVGYELLSEMSTRVLLSLSFFFSPPQ